MKYRYIPQEDILTIFINQGQLDHAEDKDGVIVHYDKNQKPLLIEILDASQFLRKKRAQKTVSMTKV